MLSAGRPSSRVKFSQAPSPLEPVQPQAGHPEVAGAVDEGLVGPARGQAAALVEEPPGRDP